MYPRLFMLIATFFNVGKSPKAPGTMGTLAAIPLWYFLAKMPEMYYLIAVFLICILGIFAAQVYEKEMGTHDSGEIVIDEVAGYLITMALLPVTWKSAVLGFILFRILDILKPFPIGMLDKKIQGGVGVMADDIAAGIIASVLLQVAMSYIPNLFI